MSGYLIFDMVFMVGEKYIIFENIWRSMNAIWELITLCPPLGLSYLAFCWDSFESSIVRLEECLLFKEMRWEDYG